MVISLGLPKWRDDAKQWPVCHLLTPRWSYFHAEPDEFERQYVAQLDRFGAEKITRSLERIATETGANRLVLLCHEADRARRHRGTFADWWLSATGEEVPELDPPTQ